jgi:riboflavin-specific deaminase-like protein
MKDAPGGMAKLKSAQPERPFVLVNMAITADGKIANRDRTIDSFSSARDQANLLGLRATTDAVLCGASTVNGRGVTLDVGGEVYRRQRRRRGLSEAHLRVVVSGRARLRPDADIFGSAEAEVIVVVTRAAPGSRVERLRRVAHTVGAWGDTEVDFRALFRWLAAEKGVRRLVCEGGGELNDALFRARLVDELHLTICPKVFGGGASPTMADGLGVPTLARATPLHLQKARRVGQELFLTYRVGDS